MIRLEGPKFQTFKPKALELCKSCPSVASDKAPNRFQRVEGRQSSVSNCLNCPGSG